MLKGPGKECRMESIKYTIDTTKIMSSYPHSPQIISGWVGEGEGDYESHWSYTIKWGPYHCENLTLGPCTGIKRGQSEVTN